MNIENIYCLHIGHIWDIVSRQHLRVRCQRCGNIKELEPILHNICAVDGDLRFRVGNSKIIWESASYNRNDKLIISRVCKEGEKGGKPFLMGLRYKSRIANPKSMITLV